MESRLTTDLLEPLLKVPYRLTPGWLRIEFGAAFPTTPEFWLNAQKAVDLYKAARRITGLPRPLPRAS